MKSTLLVTFILLVSSCYSQSPFNGEIRWGEPQKSKFNTIPDPIGYVGNKLFVTQSKRSKHTLESYDIQSLGFNSSDNLAFEYKGNKLGKNKEFIVDDDLVFITDYKNKSQKKLYYFIQRYKNGGKLSDPIPIATIDYTRIPNYGITKKGAKRAAQGRNAFKIVQSKDKKLLLALYAEEILDEGSQTWTAKLFNTSLEEVWKYAFIVPEKGSVFIDQIKVSNDGVAYAMGMSIFDVEMDPRSISVIGENVYSFVSDSLFFLKIDGKNEEIIISEITTPMDQDVASVAFDLVDGGLMFYGMFGKREKNLVTGTFFVKMDFDGNELFSTKDDFDVDFITQHWKDRKKNKAKKKEENSGKKPKMYKYILRDLLQKENGELILTAEQYYVYTSITTTSGADGSMNTTENTNYVYNDIIVVNCDKNGAILWKSLVHKKQKSVNDGGYFSSFFGITSGDDLFLIFNDSEYDVNKEELEGANLGAKIKAKWNTVASFVAFDNSGEQSHEILFDFPDDRRRKLVPKVCGKISENEIFLFTKTKKRMTVLGVVNF
ncbi:MAG: hypothetical protein ACI837_001974 [Crocinitomicaceae bacterium]|jgi:hypothetical protein